MLNRFRLGINWRIFFVFAFFFVLGVRECVCQESDQRKPNQFFSLITKVKKYLQEMKEKEVREEEVKYKEIIELSRNEISIAQNISKKDIIYDSAYMDNDGWVLYFYKWQRHPLLLIKVHVSSDKRSVKIAPPGPFRFSE